MAYPSKSAVRRWLTCRPAWLSGGVLAVGVALAMAAVFAAPAARTHTVLLCATALLPTVVLTSVRRRPALQAGMQMLEGPASLLLARLARPDSMDPVMYYDIARYVEAAVGAKDEHIRGHSERTAEYAVVLGQELGLRAEELDRLRLAALLHDIGKLGVRSTLLRKAGRLTPGEREEVRQHVRNGAHMLRGHSALANLLPGVEFHHESWDGAGYPYGLSGESIPRMARIIAVADTYDALTSDRVYQTHVSPEEAVAVIRSLSGTRLWPEAVRAFDRAYARGALQLSPVLEAASAAIATGPVHHA